jgi:hypothetical protein
MDTFLGSPCSCLWKKLAPPAATAAAARTHGHHHQQQQWQQEPCHCHKNMFTLSWPKYFHFHENIFTFTKIFSLSHLGSLKYFHFQKKLGCAAMLAFSGVQDAK